MDLFDTFKDVNIQVRSSINNGIASSINRCLKVAFEAGADFVTILGNDIIEPATWLQIREEMFHKTGCAVGSIPPHNHYRGCRRYKRQEFCGFGYEIGHIIGNYTISRQCWDLVGKMCEDYDPYGPIDLDYCDRVFAAGLICCYASDFHSRDIGTPVMGDDEEYEERKKNALMRSWSKYATNKQLYSRQIRIKQ